MALLKDNSMKKLNHLSHAVRAALVASVAAGATVAMPAVAQDADVKSVEKIAVVGTRAAPRSVGESPVPVDIIGAEELRAQGSTDMISMLQTVVPSLNVNDQPINDASTLVRPTNLRGLAPDHTLVLVNGKRRHRSAVITFLGGQISDGAHGPDISAIPAIAMKQIEVLRDGAAAQYGSDAIAGVINFALKDDADGGMLEVNAGEFTEGDGQTLLVAGNFGANLSENGFINLSFESRTAEPTSRSVQRDDAQGLIDAGNSFVAQPAAQVWGTPEIKKDFKVFMNAGLELDADSEAYLFGGVSQREVEGGFYFRNPHNRGGVNDGGTTEDGEQLLLIADLTADGTGNCPTIAVGDNVLANPRYINEVANNPDCFAFNELLPGGFTPKFGGVVTDTSLVMGTRGELESETNYDVSVSFGENEIEYLISNTINPSLGPNTPMSFKPGTYTQTEVAFNADFNKYITDAFFAAAGVEYRYEAFDSIAGDPASYEVGPLAAQGFGIGSNGFPGLSARYQGKASRNSFALYADSELNVDDVLTIGAALRYEDFTDFGATVKGKVSARYQIDDNFAIRGAFATGFKAPTIGQSSVRNVSTAFGPNGLQDEATLPPTDAVSIRKGAQPLSPEESTSMSVGLVAEFDNGLFVTLDYFDIEVDDRLAISSTIALTDDDRSALAAAGNLDASSLSSIKFFTNAFSTETSGVDLVANYTMDMGEGETAFALAANWTDTEVSSVKAGAQGLFDATRIRMFEENLPAFRASLTANHTVGDVNVLARVNYFDSIFEDHLDAGGALPIEVGAETTVDIEVGYNYTDNLRVSVGMKNAFDERPDNNPWAGVVGSAYPTTSPIGINGGYYYGRVVYSF